MAIQFVCSLIFVEDIARSRQFYEGLLGQQVLMDHGANVAFAGGFAIHQADHAFQVFFGQPAPKTERWGADNGELYFETAEPEAVQTRLLEAGVEFLHTLREHPWQQRAMRVRDPDGHIIEIGEPMSAAIGRLLQQGLSPVETARRCSMPLEIVLQIAGATGIA